MDWRRFNPSLGEPEKIWVLTTHWEDAPDDQEVVPDDGSWSYIKDKILDQAAESGRSFSSDTGESPPELVRRINEQLGEQFLMLERTTRFE